MTSWHDTAPAEAEMTRESHHVFLEEPGGARFAQSMKALQAWLADNEVEPIGVEYVTTASGSIIVELTFENRDQASLFERTFCNVAW